MFKRFFRRYLLKRAKKQGLQIGEKSVILGFPKLGSEPYLISIGSNVTVTDNVSFITHDGATRVFRNNSKFKDVIKYGRITIHNNCFIGTNSTILPNVSIGPNSIVAAGSIVVSDVPPNTIVGGNPAKVISTLESYANKCLASTPNYDKLNYKQNKVEEILKLYPKPW